MFESWMVNVLCVAGAVVVALAGYAMFRIGRQEDDDGRVLKRKQDAWMEMAHKSNKMNRPPDDHWD